LSFARSADGLLLLGRPLKDDAYCQACKPASLHEQRQFESSRLCAALNYQWHTRRIFSSTKKSLRCIFGRLAFSGRQPATEPLHGFFALSLCM
jgi:hypothetical protein